MAQIAPELRITVIHRHDIARYFCFKESEEISATLQKLFDGQLGNIF